MKLGPTTTNEAEHQFLRRKGWWLTPDPLFKWYKPSDFHGFLPQGGAICLQASFDKRRKAAGRVFWWKWLIAMLFGAIIPATLLLGYVITFAIEDRWIALTEGDCISLSAQVLVGCLVARAAMAVTNS